MRTKTREKRFAAAGETPPPTRGVPVQLTDGTWWVRLMCPDGRRRVFRTAAAVKYDRRRKEVAVTPSARFAILNRDRYRCRYCGRTSAEVKLHVDHVIPVVEGGSADPSNLVTACDDCNLGKGATSA